MSLHGSSKSRTNPSGERGRGEKLSESCRFRRFAFVMVRRSRLRTVLVEPKHNEGSIMRNTHRLIPLLLAALIPLGAAADDLPGRHPAYLHALTDLRAARWLIEHRPGDARVSGDEDVAITRIDEAIGEIKRAAIEDGKNIQEHPPVDMRLDNRGRLHRAEELLRKVHDDIAREEDDPLTRGLRDRAVRHVDDALDATHRAIADAERGL